MSAVLAELEKQYLMKPHHDGHDLETLTLNTARSHPLAAHAVVSGMFLGVNHRMVGEAHKIIRHQIAISVEAPWVRPIQVVGIQ